MSCLRVRVGTTTILTVTGLRNAQTNAYINDGTVECTLLDANGDEVAGQTWPVTLTYVTASNGEYSAEIENDLVIESGDTGTAELDITGDGATLALVLPVEYVSSSDGQLQWTSRDEIEQMFGVTNVTKWADLENTQVAATITEQINWSVLEATDEVKELLPGTAASFVTCAPRPLRRAVTVLAAELLYEARGIDDTSTEDGVHRLTQLANRARTYLRKVQAGAIRVKQDAGVTSFPKVVPHVEPVDDYDTFQII